MTCVTFPSAIVPSMGCEESAAHFAQLDPVAWMAHCPVRRLRLQYCRAPDDVQEFGRNLLLTRLVISQREVLNHILRRFAGVPHGDHSGGLLTRLQLENRMIEL